MSILGVVKDLLPILIPLHYVDKWIGFIWGVCQASFFNFLSCGPIKEIHHQKQKKLKWNTFQNW
jgi:hypothetical protein